MFFHFPHIPFPWCPHSTSAGEWRVNHPMNRRVLAKKCFSHSRKHRMCQNHQTMVSPAASAPARRQRWLPHGLRAHMEPAGQTFSKPVGVKESWRRFFSGCSPWLCYKKKYSKHRLFDIRPTGKTSRNRFPHHQGFSSAKTTRCVALPDRFETFSERKLDGKNWRGYRKAKGSLGQSGGVPIGFGSEMGDDGTLGTGQFQSGGGTHPERCLWAGPKMGRLPAAAPPRLKNPWHHGSGLFARPFAERVYYIIFIAVWALSAVSGCATPPRPASLAGAGTRQAPILASTIAAPESNAFHIVWIEKARTECRVAYGYSHSGRQILAGLENLELQDRRFSVDRLGGSGEGWRSSATSFREIWGRRTPIAGPTGRAFCWKRGGGT